MKSTWFCLVALLLASCRTAAPAIDWTAYGHDAHGTRHSPASQITRQNVSQLGVAWIYRTGDYGLGAAAARFEATPLFVDGTLYLSTPYGRVMALDPDSGVERWSYDPGIDFTRDYGDFANRGVSAWRDNRKSANQRCAQRIFVATIDSRLIALDSATGTPCADFGANGQLSLERDLGNAPRYKGEYSITSPPAIAGDLVIVGSEISDNVSKDSPSGVVRAYDARSGALRWKWDPLPPTPNVGAANAWSVFSVDPERDLLFVPVGSASPDFYGGDRLGPDLYANSVVALRASTGEMVWHFQVVHHDLWDYDVPAQPVLADWNGTPAVIQPTKMGNIFFLDRMTGKPLIPVEEINVPASDVPGEVASATQPFTSNPPLVPQKAIRIDDVREECRGTLASLRNEGIFTPPSLRGTLVWPGNIGGSYWGSVSVDQERQVIIAPTNRVATIITLFPAAQLQEARRTAGGAEIGPMRGAPYGMKRDWLLTADHIPCTPPPWGALSAVDLRSGAIRWEVPLGYLPWIPQGLEREKWGSINLGGAMTTAGGIAFVAGTYDEHLFAFDVESGRELWRHQLPAGGNALPMTYVSHGRQFVVIAAGGHDRLHTKLGDYVVAFSLPSAPPPPVSSPNVTGTWSGDLLVGHLRAPLQVHFNHDGRGSMESKDLTADFTWQRSSNSINYQANFRYLPKSCGGTMKGSLDIANAGRLLIGELQLEHNCGTSPEPATLSLKR